MRKLTMIVVPLALVLAVAAPAWAGQYPQGIKVVTGWYAANTTGLEVGSFLGPSSGSIGVAAPIPVEDTMKMDSIAALEAAYKYNPQGVESALGTFHNYTPVAYSSGLIAYMARVGFNPAVVGGPDIPPGSVTPVMMPNGYLLIDDGGQLNPGQTPKALSGAVSTPAPPTVGGSTPVLQYVKPQPQEVQTRPTSREVSATSPSVPAPGQGTSAPQKLTPDQQKAAALHVPVKYVTNPPKVKNSLASPSKFLPWKWVCIGGGVALLIALAAVFVIKNRRSRYGG